MFQGIKKASNDSVDAFFVPCMEQILLEMKREDGKYEEIRINWKQIRT